jgi:hypothetical protein
VKRNRAGFFLKAVMKGDLAKALGLLAKDQPWSMQKTATMKHPFIMPP